MALSANNTLITSANVTNIDANGTNDTYVGTDHADAFVIADGNTGKDAIVGFDVNDVLINSKKIYDGNKDGYIDFGPNSVLDVDRTSSRNAGQDQIAVSGEGNQRVTTIRYLGYKDGGYAYGAADVRDNFLGHFKSGFDSTHGVTGGDAAIQTFQYKYDSSVASDTYDFGKGSSVLLIDNADGLNFGGDTINNFGNDDLLVTTSKLYDSNSSGFVTFGGNKVLDLSGSDGPQSTDPQGGPGGQVDVNNPDKQVVAYLGQETIGGTTYYIYGAATASFAGHGTYIDHSTYSGPALNFDHMT